MVKVINVCINVDTVSMDCLKNGNEMESYHVVLDKDSLEPLSGTNMNPYVCRAIAMARRYRNRTGAIPAEFISAWH